MCDSKCPICLSKKDDHIICKNNHKTCKPCIIIWVHNRNYKCPICRDDLYVNNYTLDKLDTPLDYKKVILQSVP